MKYFKEALAILLFASVAVNAKQSDIPKGKQLISKSDCMGCHTEKVKILGPAYADIAAKYPANSKNISALAQKVIKGSKGVWGDIPMIEHAKLSKSDAEEMVKYILSVKK